MNLNFGFVFLLQMYKKSFKWNNVIRFFFVNLQKKLEGTQMVHPNKRKSTKTMAICV